MKKKLNLFLLISFILALSLTIWIYYLSTNNVGDIKFDKKMDDSEFKVCDEKKTFQYYHLGTAYKGGKKEIKKELSKLISNLTFKNDGFITFRFVVNCKGKTGRFRVKTINSDLKENTVAQSNIKLIEKEILKMQYWNVGYWNDKNFDSYYLLNFKIKGGKIVDTF